MIHKKYTETTGISNNYTSCSKCSKKRQCLHFLAKQKSARRFQQKCIMLSGIFASVMLIFLLLTGYFGITMMGANENTVHICFMFSLYIFLFSLVSFTVCIIIVFILQIIKRKITR